MKIIRTKSRSARNPSRTGGVIRAAAALALAIVPSLALAQAYPSKPVRLVTPYAPGGITDQLARLAAEKLKDRLGQPFIVENKAGGGTTIASNYAAKQPNDGYTLYQQSATLGRATVLYDGAAYDPVRDFAAIGTLCNLPIVFIAAMNTPFKSVAELIAFAKTNPGKLSQGVAGIGSLDHIAGEMFARQAGIKVNFIPYKGGALALNDVLGGRLDLQMDSWVIFGPQVAAGRIKALAALTATRSSSLPDMVTAAESGLPGYEAFGAWFGLFTMAGVPRDIITRLNREIGEILKDPDLQARYKTWGMSTYYTTPEQMAELLKKDIASVVPLIKELGIKL